MGHLVTFLQCMFIFKREPKLLALLHLSILVVVSCLSILLRLLILKIFKIFFKLLIFARTYSLKTFKLF